MTPIRGPLARLERSRDELAKAVARPADRARLARRDPRAPDREDRARAARADQRHRRTRSPSGNGDPFELTRSRPSGRRRWPRSAAAAARPARRTSRATWRRSRPCSCARCARSSRTTRCGSPRRSSGWPRPPAPSRPRRSRSCGRPARASSSRRPTPTRSPASATCATSSAELATLLDVQKRYEHPFAVLLMDIDGLKRINDSHGHPAGDRVLMQVGDVAAPVDPDAWTWRRGSAATSSACSRRSRT